MNILEALKSKRPIKRKVHDYWMDINEDYLRWVLPRGTLNKQDILAQDWEIQEQETTLTKQQYWDAVCNIFGLRMIDNGFGLTFIYKWNEDKKLLSDLQLLAHRLGLK